MNSTRSLVDLTVHGLYVALYTVSDPHKPDKFNWRLYLHESQFGGGILYVMGIEDDLNALHRQTTSVLGTVVLVGLIRIATINPIQSLRSTNSSEETIVGSLIRRPIRGLNGYARD